MTAPTDRPQSVSRDASAVAQTFPGDIAIADDSGRVSSEATSDSERPPTGVLSDTNTPTEPVGQDGSHAAAVRPASPAGPKPPSVDDAPTAITQPSTPMANAHAAEPWSPTEFSDDNVRFHAFLRYLDNYRSARHLPIPVADRRVLTFADEAGHRHSYLDVVIISGGFSQRYRTAADGSILFYPGEFADDTAPFVAMATLGDQEVSTVFDRHGPRRQVIPMAGERLRPERISLDIVFVLDTTGSMGREISALQESIERIYTRLGSAPGTPNVRLGLVLYKDEFDDYVTHHVPLTADLSTLQAELNSVYPDGGGDTPEDLQRALGEAVFASEWNETGTRLVYVITDAPPQFYGADPNYVKSVRAAAERGVKIHALGTGGIGVSGEYVLRQIAQYTGGLYAYLAHDTATRMGAATTPVAHHRPWAGANSLESVVVGSALAELRAATDPVPGNGSDLRVVLPSDGRVGAVALDGLLVEMLHELVARSTIAIPLGSPAAVSLITVHPPNSAVATYASGRLWAAAGNLQLLRFDLSLEASHQVASRQAGQDGHILIEGEVLLEDDVAILRLRLVGGDPHEELSSVGAMIERVGIPLGGN